jgi:hypothetical protein
MPRDDLSCPTGVALEIELARTGPGSADDHGGVHASNPERTRREAEGARNRSDLDGRALHPPRVQAERQAGQRQRSSMF